MVGDEPAAEAVHQGRARCDSQQRSHRGFLSGLAASEGSQRARHPLPPGGLGRRDRPGDCGLAAGAMNVVAEAPALAPRITAACIAPVAAEIAWGDVAGASLALVGPPDLPGP